MSNVDERVVVLRFENSDFEQRTRQSIDSLNRLDDSIKKAGSGKEMDGLKKAANSIDLGKVSKSVDTVNHRMSAMGIVGATAIGKLTASAMDFGKNLLFAIPNQIRQGGLTRALNIEQAKFQIEGLKGNWDDVAKAAKQHTITIKDAVNNAVKGTAYGLDEAARIGSQLMASGIKDGRELEVHLKAVAGLAAMTGSNYSDIGRIFAQVAGQGRLMGDQLLQISTRGINAASTISNYLNSSKSARDHVIKYAKDVGASGKKAVAEFVKGGKVTEATVRDLVSAGVIDFQTFSTAMNKAFGKHATAANQTYTGSLANMKAALSRIGADVQTQKLENMRRLFNTLTPIIDGIHKALGPLIEVLNRASKKMTDFAVNALTQVSKHFGWLDKASDNTTKKTSSLANNVDKVTSKISGAVKKTTSVLTISKKEAKAAFDIWNKGTYGTGDERVKSLAQVGYSYKHVQAYVNALQKANFDLSKVNIKVGDSEKAKLRATAKAADASAKNTATVRHETKTTSALANVLITVINIARAVGNVIKAIGNVIIFVGKVIKAFFSPFVKALTGSVGSLSTHIANASKRFADWTGKLFNNSKALKDVHNSSIKLKDKLAGLLSTMKEHIAASKTWQRLGASLKKLFSYLKAGFIAIGNGIAKFFRSLHSGKGSEKFRKSLVSLGAALKALLKIGFEKFVSGFEKFVNLLGKANIGENFISGLTAINGGFTSLIKHIIGVENPLSKLTKTFGKTQSAAKKLGTTKVDTKVKVNGKTNVSESTSPFSIFQNIYDKINTFWSGGKKAFGALKKFFIYLAESTKLGEKLKQAYEYLSNCFGYLAEAFDVRKLLKNADADSILSVVKEFVKIAIAIKVVSDAGKVAKGASKALTGIGSFFSSFAQVGCEITKAVKAYEKSTKIKSFALAVIALAAVIASIGFLAKIPTKGLVKGIASVAIVFGMIIALMKIMTSATVDEKRLQEMAITFIGLGAAMLMIAISAKKFAAMSGKDLLKAGLAIGSFLTMFGALSHLAGSVAKAGSAFLLIAMSLNALIPAIVTMAHIKPETLIRGGSAVLSFMTMMALASHIANNSIKGSAGFLAMAAAVGIIVPSVILLGLVPFGKVIKGAVAISVVMSSLALAARLAGESAKTLHSVAAMAAMIATIAGSLVILSFIDGGKLLKAAAALVSTVAVFTLAGQVAKGSLRGLITLAVMLGTITGIFVLLIKMNPNAVLKVAISLSAVAASLSIAMGVFSLINVSGALKAIGAFAIFIAGLTGILMALGAINQIPGVQELVKSGGSLFSKIGSAIGGFVGSIVSGFAKASAASLPQVGDKLKEFGSKLSEFFNGIKGINAESLGKLKGIAKAMSDLTSANALNESNGGTKGIKGLCKAVDSFVTGISPVINKAKGLNSEGVKALSDLGNVAQEFGNAAGKMSSTFSLKLPFLDIEKNSGFNDLINGIVSLVHKVQGMDLSSGDFEGKVSQLSKVASLVSHFASAAQNLPRQNIEGGSFYALLMGTKSLSKFGTEISKLASSLNGIDIGEDFNTKISQLSKAARMVSKLAYSANQIPANSASVLTFFTGYKDLGVFANQIYTLASEISNVSIDSSFAMKVEALSNASKAVSKLAIASKSIPANTPSVATFFTGYKDLGKFASQIASVATEINNVPITDPGSLQTKAQALIPAAKVVSVLASAQSNLQSTSSFNGGTTDYSSLISFTKSVAHVATQINGISISGDFEGKANQLKSAASAIKALSSVAASMPKAQTAVSAFFTGKKQSIGEFADYIKKIMPKIKGAVNSASGIGDVGKFKSVSYAIKAMARASKIASDAKSGSGTQLVLLAKGVKKFASETKDINGKGLKEAGSAISSAVKAITKSLSGNNGKFKSAGSRSMTGYVAGLKSARGRAISAARSIVSGVKSTLHSANLKSSGDRVGNTFVSGIKSKSGAAHNAGRSLSSKAVSGLKAHSGHSAGVNLGVGYVNGVNAKKGAAYRAGYEVGAAGARGVKDGSHEKSPSKLTYLYGEYLGEGFILGMEALHDKVHKSGYALGATGTEGVNEAINLMNSMDPTITPVVDMTNVQQSAGQIDSMLNASGSINAVAQAQTSINRQNSREISEASRLSGKLDRIASTMEQQKSGNITNIGDVTLDVKDLKDILTLDDFVAVVKRAKAFG